MVLLDAGEDNGVGPVPTFAWGWFVLNVVLVLAAPVAFLFARQVDEGVMSMAALVVVLVYMLLVASLLARRRGAPTARLGAEASVTECGSAEGACAAAVRKYGLTQREAEVLRLLARGRSVPFIADALSISQSTTKGHVKHIYAKMGVGTKQELLTQLDEGASRGSRLA